METLNARFSKVPAKLLKQLQAIDSIERLKALHRQALWCQNLTQFKGVLAPK